MKRTHDQPQSLHASSWRGSLRGTLAAGLGASLSMAVALTALSASLPTDAEANPGRRGHIRTGRSIHDSDRNSGHVRRGPGARPGRGNGHGRGDSRGRGRVRRGPGGGHVPPGHARRITQPPVRAGHLDDEAAANLIAESIMNLGCDRAGEMLVNLSNKLLSYTRFASEHPGRGRGHGLREKKRREWAERLRRREFWQSVWERAAEAFRSCDRLCFDDGVAVGEISALGYCSASVEFGGLTAPGLAVQMPLPVCESAITVGCRSAYQNAAAEFDGCSTYTSGAYEDIFNEYLSQDCSIDEEVTGGIF